MNRILKLGDCIESISEKKKFESNKIIFLNTSDILDGKIVNQEFVDVNTLPGQAKKSIKNNDILYSEIRPKNKRFMLVNDINEDDFVVSTKLMVLRNKREDILKTRYLYYFLTSTKMIDYLQNLAEGRSGTFPQITFSELKGIDIFIPSIEMQDRFIDAVYSIETRANLLGSINDNLVIYISSLIIAFLIFLRTFISFLFASIVFNKGVMNISTKEELIIGIDNFLKSVLLNFC